MANNLVVTGGMFPQVVTETLFGLARPAPGVEAFLPDRVVCLVTGAARHRFAGELPDRIERLWRDWDLAGPPPRLEVHAPLLNDGDADAPRFVQDLRSQREAELFADLVTREVWQLTRDVGDVLHMSMVGGRKSMSAYAMAAMMIYGRPRDHLSHVLIEPQALEGPNDFWYPTPVRHIVATRDGDIDAAAAKVIVIDEPFLRVPGLPRALTAQPLSYGLIIRELNLIHGREKFTVEVDASTCTIRTPGAEIKLLPQAFALYRLMAERWQLESSGAGPAGVGPMHHGWLARRMLSHPEEFASNPVKRYLEIYADLPGSRNEVSPFLYPAPTTTTAKKANLAFFGPLLSVIKKCVGLALPNPLIANLVLLVESRRPARYGLGIPADNLTIID